MPFGVLVLRRNSLQGCTQQEYGDIPGVNQFDSLAGAGLAIQRTDAGWKLQIAPFQDQTFLTPLLIPPFRT